MDFTLKTYKILLSTLSNQGFLFLSFNEFISGSTTKTVVLRHDADYLLLKSVKFAKIEHELKIGGTYYFRVKKEKFDEEVIKEIHSMGHEIGYHYENLGAMAQRHKGITAEEKLVRLAIKNFTENLERLRKIVPVKTICMHGSPMSRWDSRLLWKYYDYHDFGIVGEPYFDINFSDMLYLTDTGRRWDGSIVSIRDKAHHTQHTTQGFNSYEDWKVKPIPGSLMNMTQESIDFQKKYNFKSTSEIIRSAERAELPDKIMMTFHPQRWSDRPGPWFEELVWQNVKNVGKYFLVKLRE